MVESNKPINSTNNDQVWDGMAIGAGAGAGIAGMTMGGAYAKHRFNASRRDAVWAKHKEGMDANFVNHGVEREDYLKEMKVRGSATMDPKEFREYQGRTAHSRMSGGWKRAGIIAGLTGAGTIAGAAIDNNQK